MRARLLLYGERPTDLHLLSQEVVLTEGQLDSSYQVFRQLSPAGSIKGDFHEIKFTKDDTVLITMYEVAPADLTSFGVFGQGWISDSIFQEIDIETGELIFEWRASQHYAINDTFETIGSKGQSPEKPWDFFHINSIDKDDRGNYHVSSRFMHSITCISPEGDVRWVLGGRRNDFMDISGGEAISYKWQHDMTLHDNMTISLFDNAEHDKFKHDGTIGRGMVLALDIEQMTVELVRTFENPDGRAPPSQGSMQYDASTGTAFIGWGFHGGYTDFDSEGNVICHAHITPSLTFDLGWVHSYRTIRIEAWVGRPAYPPSIYMAPLAGKAFVSWNGATKVVRWRVEMAQLPDTPGDELEFVETAHATKRGFETAVDVPARYGHGYLRVSALDAENNVLGYTTVVDTRKGTAPKILSPRLRLQQIVSDIPKYLLAALVLAIVLWSVRKRLIKIARLCAKLPLLTRLIRRPQAHGKAYELQPLYRD